MVVPVSCLKRLDRYDGLIKHVLSGVFDQQFAERLLQEREDAVSPQLWNRLKALYPHGEIDNIFSRGTGCPHCDGMGLVGQQVAAEVISVSTERKLLALLRENKLWEARQYWLRDMEGISHVAHALKRIADGEVDPAIAEERLGITLDHDLAFSMKPEARSRISQFRRPALFRPRKSLWRAA